MALRSFSPAAERNRAPILTALQARLPPSGHLLEIASGTGQHAIYMAAALAGWVWQPSDLQTEALGGLCEATPGTPGAGDGLGGVDGTALACVPVPPGLRPALHLDVRDPVWPSGPGRTPFGPTFDAIYCANLLHIAPWACCGGLMQGAARCLRPGGQLFTYGPFFEDGVAPAPGNLAFDQSLRQSNPDWGIRRLAFVRERAQLAGLCLHERLAMPANNLLLVWRLGD